MFIGDLNAASWVLSKCFASKWLLRNLQTAGAIKSIMQTLRAWSYASQLSSNIKIGTLRIFTPILQSVLTDTQTQLPPQYDFELTSWPQNYHLKVYIAIPLSKLTVLFWVSLFRLPMRRPVYAQILISLCKQIKWKPKTSKCHILSNCLIGMCCS